jgi:hypothetical protein
MLIVVVSVCCCVRFAGVLFDYFGFLLRRYYAVPLLMM